MRRDVFQAIADPTRREILNMIAYQSLNLNAVAENFTMSRPAISKHMKILTVDDQEANLILLERLLNAAGYTDLALMRRGDKVLPR